MRLLLASGCVAAALLSAAPSYAQIDVGSGLVGAGAGAAIGAIAGGGRGAATGALVGGTVGAATGAFSPRPSYAYHTAVMSRIAAATGYQRIITAGANGGLGTAHGIKALALRGRAAGRPPGHRRAAHNRGPS